MIARADHLGVGLMALGALLIAGVRGRLFEIERRVKETSDVYVLPPAAQVKTLSLGYHAALADLLWSHVLVSQGLHTFEKRRYENLTLLLDTINELDPTFRDPYLMADALITFQTSETPVEEVRKAREIMERGVRNRPLDGELWLVLGQFVGMIAPGSYLTDPEEQKAWRAAAAPMLARAAELGGDNANISWQALAGAGMFSRAGERDAAIRFLRRTQAVTDDDELKAKIQRQLDALVGEERAEVYKRQSKIWNELWRKDLPFATKTTILVLGPPRDPAACAGPSRAQAVECSQTWREWSERQR